MSRVIALIDCNSFYCSCERLFRPELKNTPVVVLSNNDGCAVSRTPEAKALGIKMGAPFFEFKHLTQTHGLKVFSANFALYTNLSDRVMKTLKKLASDIEIYSVDEAFLDLTGMNNLDEYGQHIKHQVLLNVGIPVGVGIAPTKVLAKLANHVAKKSLKARGVVNLMSRKLQDAALAQVAIEDVWGIGRANSKKMYSLGIKTAKDLRDYKNEKLIQKIFTITGLQIKQELMGVECLDFHKKEAPKKQIMCSRSFAEEIHQMQDMREIISQYISDVAEKLRAQKSLCQVISVFARTSDFKADRRYSFYQNVILTHPTSNTFELIEAALAGLKQGFRTGFAYKKAGVCLGNFYPETEMQLDLFQNMQRLQNIKLMHVMDAINQRAGEMVLKSGACGVTDHGYRMNRNFKSPRYTTSWIDLPRFA